MADPPRLEQRYGGTFLCLDGKRMVVGRGIPSFQLGDRVKEAVARSGEALVFLDHQIDCAQCRKERERFSDREALARSKGFDDYWCNHCQGTGWALEPWEEAIKRHSILTWADVAASLTDPEFQAELLRPRALRGEHRIPDSVLRNEAARRLMKVPGDA